MRWHVQGTDAVTGEEVELAVNDAQASEAVQAAIDRHILVRHVRAGKQGGRARYLVPLTLSLVIALAAVGTGLFIQNRSLRGTLDQALADQSRTAASVSAAQRTAVSLRDSGQLTQGAAAQISQLADELAATRGQMDAARQQLSAADRQMSDLQRAAEQVPGLQGQVQAAQQKLAEAQRQLAASQAEAERLTTELSLQSRRMDTLQNAKVPVDPAAAKVAELEKANAGLALAIEKLKAELLELAAKPAEPATPAEAAGPTRWPLGVSYNAAQVFLVMHADGTELISRPQGGLTSTAAINSANAVKMSILQDREKELIYTATLTVSLAADAPADKLAENKALIGEFVKAFASDVKSPEAVVAATGLLPVADDARRVVFLGAMNKVTVWHEKGGGYVVEVESGHEGN